VEVVRKILTSLPKYEGAELEILYLGAPKYQLRVVSDDFKKADKAMESAVESILSFAKETKSVAEFSRLQA